LAATSVLGSDILERGIRTVVNVDFCQLVVAHTAKLYWGETPLAGHEVLIEVF
jgi:hypothetical protein